MSFKCVEKRSKKIKLSVILAATFATTSLFCTITNTAYANVLNKGQQSKKNTAKQELALEGKTEINDNTNHWEPNYHIFLPEIIFNEPYALAQYKDTYHIFYGTSKLIEGKEKNVWGHITSKDFINWKPTKNAIEPTEEYEKDNIYGGSAIVADGLLYIMYTGEYGNSDTKETIHQTQNIAMSKDGWNFGKSANNTVIPEAPNYSYLEFSSKDFRNPYVWKLEDRYYALVGSKYLKGDEGAVLLFKSKDLRNWVCINVSALGKNKEMGNMWEHPALLHIDNADILAFSTQGIQPRGKMFLNKKISGAFIGYLDYNSGKFTQKGAYQLFDHGFDFYAPKFLKTEDGRHILIASFDSEKEQTQSENNNSKNLFTIPREIRIVNEKITTNPINELQNLREHKISQNNQIISSERTFDNIDGEVYEIDTTIDMSKAKNFTIKVRTSDTLETVITYDKENKILKLNRDKSSVNSQVENITGEREVELGLIDNKLKLNIFVDKSSIELFASDGQVAMSSRIFPDKNATGIKFSAEGEAKLEKFDFYKLKSIKMN